jgi:hypothetical protein
MDRLGLPSKQILFRGAGFEFLSRTADMVLLSGCGASACLLLKGFEFAFLWA